MEWFLRYSPILSPPAVAWTVGIMAAFVGLVVFVTIALDHPFQGDVTPAETGFRYIADRPFGGR